MKAFTRRALIVSSLVFANAILAAENSPSGTEPRSSKVGATNRTKAVPVSQSRPRYPADMRKQGIAGEVVVAFTIDESGKVIDARAVRSTRKEFEAAAVEAVSKWKFKPATRDGVAEKSQMQAPIVFSLNSR